MKVVTEFLSNINICYVMVNVLLLVDIYLYLKEKKLKPLKRRSILLGGFIVNILFFNYFSGIFDIIFSLKYLSIKSFLILIVATIGIILFTRIKNPKLIYSILNYTLAILIATITFSVIVTAIGNQYPKMYVMDISNIVTLIDLSMIIFIIYLIITSIIYIGYHIFTKNTLLEIKNYINKKKNTTNKKELKVTFLPSKESYEEEKKVTMLTDEELLNYEDKENFYINGVQCSIIFEDSIKENIIKNYHILLEDIHGTMVNGFTLEENQLLKSICNKLQISDLNSIDLHNLNILNRVTIEEYNFLKKIS